LFGFGTGRGTVGAAIAAAGMLVIVGLTAVPSGAATGVTVSAMYLSDLGRSSYSPTETAIRTNNAATIQQLWSSHGMDGITAQPIVSGGMVYWSDWGGTFHATSLTTMQDVWTYPVGFTNSAAACDGISGEDSEPAVGTLNGTPVLWMGDTSADMLALNAQTGQLIWRTPIVSPGTNKIGDYFIWDAPAIYNGSLYVGVSSVCDNPLVPSGVVMMDPATGTIEHELALGTDTTSTTADLFPEPLPTTGCIADGVSGSVAVDTSTSDLFIATGNPTCPTDPFGEAIVRLSSSDLSVQDSWSIPQSQRNGDSDFVDTPTLFTANGLPMVGSADKNGMFYALRRSDLAAGPVWTYQVSDGGTDAIKGAADISPAAWDGTDLYIAGPEATVNGAACLGNIAKVNPANGVPIWRDCLNAPSYGKVLGAVVATPGLVTFNSGPSVVVARASDGKILYTHTDPTGAVYFSAPVVSGGVIYAGGNDGTLAAYAPSPPSPATLVVTRRSGSDRIATSVAASVAEFPNAGSAHAVVLARSDNFPDSLAGVPLAAAKQGPLLLTPPVSPLDPRTEAEIRRVLPAGMTVYLLGGADALDPGIATRLTSDGFTVVRLAGANRDETAVAIAGALGDPTTTFIADGFTYADALAAGPAAADLGGAVLFSDGTSPAPSTDAYLSAHPGPLYCVGGPACAAEPGEAAGHRFSGADRYATSAAVASALFPNATTVGIADGQEFPDGLSGGPTLAAMHAPLLLTAPDQLALSDQSYLGSDGQLTSAILFGGTLVLQDEVGTCAIVAAAGGGC